MTTQRIDLDKLARDVAEAIGRTKYPNTFGPGAVWSVLFSLDSCCGDDAVKNARVALNAVQPLINEHRECLDWLKAILRDPSCNESLAHGLKQFLKDK